MVKQELDTLMEVAGVICLVIYWLILSEHGSIRLKFIQIWCSPHVSNVDANMKWSSIIISYTCSVPLKMPMLTKKAHIYRGTEGVSYSVSIIHNKYTTIHRDTSLSHAFISRLNAQKEFLFVSMIRYKNYSLLKYEMICIVPIN